MIRWWLPLVLAVSSVEARSQVLLPDVYDCKVKQYLMQQDDGTLQDQFANANSAHREEAQTASFLVERRSGKFLSKAPALGWMPTFQSEVLDLGSGQQAFKVLYKSDPRLLLHVAYLEVKSYSKTAAKPFVLIDGGSVFSGTCK